MGTLKDRVYPRFALLACGGALLWETGIDLEVPSNYLDSLRAGQGTIALVTKQAAYFSAVVTVIYAKGPYHNFLAKSTLTTLRLKEFVVLPDSKTETAAPPPMFAVKILELLGVFDSQIMGSHFFPHFINPPQLYFAVFLWIILCLTALANLLAVSSFPISNSNVQFLLVCQVVTPLSLFGEFFVFIHRDSLPDVELKVKQGHTIIEVVRAMIYNPRWWSGNVHKTWPRPRVDSGSGHLKT